MGFPQRTGESIAKIYINALQTLKICSSDISRIIDNRRYLVSMVESVVL